MRIVKAYHGKYIAYRAWFNGKLIWNYGDDTMGDLVAALNTAAKPEPEVPDAILLQGEANTKGTGLAEVWELDPVLTQTGAGISSNATPRAAETVHPMAAGVIQGRATARPYTYGTVFTRGHAPAELSTQAKPNTAEAVRAVGVADFGNIDVASRPRPEEVPRILAAADATIDAPALPVLQEPEGVVMKTSNGLTSYAGADTAPVHRVTFMYGGKVLYSSSAIHGYSCTDPLTTGDVEKQEKAMTVSHTFEHTGWSLTEDGEPDASILESITEDIVVYAAFTASIRYYTVRFFDGDTLVDTVSAPYGGTAVTSYKKLGYTVTWVPSNENITGDTDCYGQFGLITFSQATWAEIAEISESGNAKNFFQVGNTKSVRINGQSLTVVILGFDHDDLADGSGKAGMTIGLKTAYPTAVKPVTSTSGTYHWANSNLRSTILGYMDAAPDDLKAVIKKVNKIHDAGTQSSNGTKTTVDTAFALGATEVTGTTAHKDGTQYEYFKTSSNRIIKYGSSARKWWLRNSNFWNSRQWLFVDTSGNYTSVANCNTASGYYPVWAFCI